ncbi:lmo0937 family membrane protein [Algibacter sp. L4_22]|nr:lmo0937 family membrane protein [Algibacter sp. L4_22]MCL5129282.1 lmo0937 family membrane protein [Algibacter sp. L4_22]
MVASVLVISWGIGFFIYTAGGLIHMLLVLALVTILPTLSRWKRK